ncbi:MAG: ribonuclease P [Candidatus Bathyarchaeota archaeon]|nr:ribonuclease P [Candidatus Bathyarchaeota archaeon]
MSGNARRIAVHRIQILFRLAQEAVHDRPDLAQRYVEIARKVAMRTRLHLPREYRFQVCRHCKRFILAGVNSRVRVQPRREPHIVVTCLHCGRHMRNPLKRRKSR